MPILTDADERLRGWLTPIAGDVPVRNGPPDDDATEPSVTAYLLGLEPTTPVGGEVHRPATLVLRLRYLVCVDGPSAEQSLALLDAILTAALDARTIDGERLEVDLAPIPADAWLALRARPRPAITLRLDARHARVPEEVPMVREPLRVVGSTIRSLTGRLLGPDDQPLAGAVVTLAGTGAEDRTSDTGTFIFPTVPAGPGPLELGVRAKGRFFTAVVDPGADQIVVRCDPLEA
jgi:hypothetical protein